MSISLRRCALGAFALLISASPALSHAVLERREAEAGSAYRGIIRIGHGCGASPTTGITLTVPDGVIGAQPMAKPGWTITTRRGAYDRPYNTAHGTASEGVKEIRWSGNTLPIDQFDEFVFTARFTDATRQGDTVYFPVVQTCGDTSRGWVEIPAPGQSAQALTSPAPGVRILGASGPATTGAMAPAVIKAGTLEIEQPWTRATPGGARVAGGFLKVTNTGTEPDRLIGASIPLAGHGEVHEMSMEGGVAQMRPVEGGIEIRPGASIVLKPGGYHLMFMDLKSGLTEGQTVKGTLTFAKAGTVEVTFEVRGLGAQGPAPMHH